MITRREFLKVSAAAIGSAFLASRARFFASLSSPEFALAAQSPQVPLAGKLIPQFVDPLPGLEAILAGPGQIELRMSQFQTKVLAASFYTALPAPYNEGTYVWGYLQPDQTERDSYLGPVIVATRGQPTQIKYVNDLGDTSTTNLDAWKYSTDQTLHWADPLNGEENMLNHMVNPPAFGSAGAQNYAGPIPGVVHLHGGEVPPLLDGGPDAWVTSDGAHKGHGFYSMDGAAATNYHIYRYPNSQEGAPIWFHDHTLGATRLNVYAGLAGGYLLLDPPNDPTNLPPLIPLVIQDRMFDTNGQLFFPADSASGVLWTTNPEHPYWVPEFIGDTICVNGKAWPYLDVEPRRYTFLFLNGSNARSYELDLVDPVSGNRGPFLWVIGTDGGYLDKPVKIGTAGNNNLLMMSGMRNMVIIDFAGFQAGVIGPNGRPYSGRWLLRNSAKAPYPGGVAPLGNTTAKVMEFHVVPLTAPDTSFNPATPGATVRPTPIVRLVDPVAGTVAAGVTVNKTRQLTLNEVTGLPKTAIDPVTGVPTVYPGGPLEILVNNTKWSGEHIVGVEGDMYKMEAIPGFTEVNINGVSTWYSELPNEGETELWEIVNLTMDAHPIHTHLVMFQLLNRQNFDTKAYNAAYAAAFQGGGYDPATGQPYPANVYIPSFGPPLDYATGNARALGGNPDIAATDAKGKSLFLKGAPVPPLPQEAGWKDTITVLPGQVTRFVVRWAPTHLPASTPPADAFFSFDPAAGGHGYVWHCHIVDHEDNEMMRPDLVNRNPNATRTYIQGRDY